MPTTLKPKKLDMFLRLLSAIQKSKPICLSEAMTLIVIFHQFRVPEIVSPSLTGKKYDPQTVCVPKIPKTT